MIGKIRTIVTRDGEYEDWLGKTMKGNFWNDSNVIYLILIWVTQLYAFLKTFPVVHLRFVHFARPTWLSGWVSAWFIGHGLIPAQGIWAFDRCYWVWDFIFRYILLGQELYLTLISTWYVCIMQLLYIYICHRYTHNVFYVNIQWLKRHHLINKQYQTDFTLSLAQADFC